MSVINCKVCYLRPTYHDLGEWIISPEHVYIGRRGVVFLNRERFPARDSMWANPYKIGRDGTREEVLAKYETSLRERLEVNEELRSELLKLDGKILGCWCAPEPCHGHVLLRLIEELKVKS